MDIVTHWWRRPQVTPLRITTIGWDLWQRKNFPWRSRLLLGRSNQLQRSSSWLVSVMSRVGLASPKGKVRWFKRGELLILGNIFWVPAFRGCFITVVLSWRPLMKVELFRCISLNFLWVLISSQGVTTWIPAGIDVPNTAKWMVKAVSKTLLNIGPKESARFTIFYLSYADWVKHSRPPRAQFLSHYCVFVSFIFSSFMLRVFGQSSRGCHHWFIQKPSTRWRFIRWIMNLHFSSLQLLLGLSQTNFPKKNWKIWVSSSNEKRVKRMKRHHHSFKHSLSIVSEGDCLHQRTSCTGFLSSTTFTTFRINVQRGC